MNTSPKRIHAKVTDASGNGVFSKAGGMIGSFVEYIHISPEQKDRIADLIEYHDSSGADHAMVAAEFCTIVEELLGESDETQ